MIYYLQMSFEHEGGQQEFVDFEDLDESLVDAILDIANRNKDRGASDWFVEGKFPKGEVDNLGDWRRVLDPEFFFTFRRFGRKVPFDPDDVRKVRLGGKYQEIEPTDAFDKLPLEILKEFAGAFREYLEDDELTHCDSDPEVIFTPLFEKEVEARK